MEMDSFNIGKHIINSFSDIVDDGFLDIKPFASDDQTFFAASPSSNHAEANHQIQTSQNQRKEAAFSQLISFGSQDPPILDSHNLLLEDGTCNMDTHITTRDPLQTQNHVFAERRRREKLTQLFISLSKILPGLKKGKLMTEAIDEQLRAPSSGKEMETGSFNCQHVINSFNDTADDGCLDIKPFVSDNQNFFTGASRSSNHTCSSQAEANHQIQTSQREAAFSHLISFGSPEDGRWNMDTHINTRDPLQAQNHVEAERRRRQKLTQLFIDLSKILPGLKKLDKASLLGDAIDHMKDLQERVRILEEEINTISNSLHPMATTFMACENQNPNGSTRRPIQEIKVKISKPNILIKIYCDKDEGLVQRLLGEMVKLHVTLSDFRVIPFGSNTLDITILAEMGSGFCSTVEDVAKQLEMAIQNPQHKQNTHAHLQEFSNISPPSELGAWPF